jgi:hypothetical protein
MPNNNSKCNLYIVGSNIMKTTLYILKLLLNGQIHPQTKKAEDFGFRPV